ncbi:MAG: restriction endonuclease subunit S [Phormidesmis sp. CAN_BIN44]|nr:restriction endonuclease subunit S [Phormidesmis sp. CAN_BIN44]
MGWSYPLVPIGELVSSVQKCDPRQSEENELFTYIDISSVNRETKKIEEASKTLSHEAPSRARQIVKAEDVLVSTVRPNLNAVAHLSRGFDGAIASTGFTVLRAKKQKLDSRYLYYWVLTPYFTEDMVKRSTGASYPAVSDSIIKEYGIPLPPIEEQRRIADILDRADAIRRKRQEAIRLTEELLRSAFLEMFGDPVTNPKNWTTVDLKSQVSELRYGTSVKCEDVEQNGDLPILRIPNIIGEQISWNDLKYTKLTSSEITKLLLIPGDLLFVRTNGNPEYIGRCAVFEEGFGQALYASYLIRARLKPNAQLHPNFIRDIISFPTYRSLLVREARTTAGNYNIGTEGLGRLRLIAPSLKEQENYIEFGQRINDRLELQKRQVEETNNFFNSLLQRAFRGKL